MGKNSLEILTEKNLFERKPEAKNLPTKIVPIRSNIRYFFNNDDDEW